MKKKKDLIVVTGAAGFIGSCLVRYVNDHYPKVDVAVVDDLGKTEKWKNLVGKGISDIISKFRCFEWLTHHKDRICAIFHLGACSNTVETDASYLLDNNYKFSRHLAEFAISNGIRFIYASSAATYGNGSHGFSDDLSLIDKLQPLNMYGFSKQLFDLWLKQEKLLNKVVGLKYFNVFGPNEAHKGRMASAITHFVPSIQREGLIRLFKSSEPERFADGGQQRDFVYVKDVVRMTCAFLENDACGIFNIGSGIPSTWNELANAVFHALKVTPKITYTSMPQDLIGKYQNYTCAEMTKTRSVLKGVADCMPLLDSVTDYVRQHLVPGITW